MSEKKIVFLLTAVVLIMSGCEPPEKPGVAFKAQVINLSSVPEDETRSRTVYGPLAETQNNLALTPSVYKIALVNFWLIKDDNTEVNLINPDESNPEYTEEDPLIIDFTSNSDPQELFSADTMTPGTYKGYKMQFLYLEMKLPVAFHLPGIADETDFSNIGSGLNILDYLDLRISRNFRLYFNAIGKYWKRDFVVKLIKNADRWFWLRRALEDQEGYRNFFISAKNNDHPPGGGAPDSTIDLFSNEDFWGSEKDLDDSSDPIIVGTHSTVGGVDAVLDKEFTIPESLDKLYTILLTVDVKDTMNFASPSNPAEGITIRDSLSDLVLDLGPGFNSEDYGNIGLHPMVPKFSITVETK